MTKTEIAFKILVYSVALDVLTGVPGLCRAISDALKLNGVEKGDAELMSYNGLQEHFPEIYKHKPERTYMGYWFSGWQTGHPHRIKILQDEIEKLFDKL